MSREPHRETAGDPIEPTGAGVDAAPRPSLARRAMAYESAMWSSFFRWVLRRPGTDQPDAEPFSYLGVVRPILIMFIVLSAVEIPIFDLIVSHLVPWRPARWIVLALGVYGLVWMLGLLAMLQLHPHLLDDDGIRVRNGATLDVRIAWADVEAVHKRYRSLPSSKGVQLERDDDGLVVNLGVGSQTSVDVTLRWPTRLALPSGPSEPTTRVRLYVDDPDAFVAAARRRLSAAAPPEPPTPGRPRTSRTSALPR
ncbi:hypothetical protein AB0J86_20835 [Micromonospora sp. NPDC049559]|uniref:hypothetical protein n=1 Tax=Micromonospora sp. NPDC049559 TaxID=3155923 RepID=UPI003437F54B